MKQLSILLLLLLVSIGLFAQAETEPNNTWDATGVLTIIDGDYTGNIPAGDHDYWKFWSVTGDQLDINCLNGATTFDTYLHLYDSTGTFQLAQNDDAGGTLQSQMLWTTSTTGWHYINMRGYSASVAGAYQLTLAGSTPNDPNMPGAPHTPVPDAGELNIAIDNGALTWQWGINTETYDLYFGANSLPTTPNVADVTADTVNGSSFDPGQLTVATTYYWQVVAKNSTSIYTQSVTWSFQTELGTNTIQVGNGTAVDQHLPIEPYSDYTYSQTIYLQSEIDMATQRIEKVYYHYTGGGTLANCLDWKIYMGHTNSTAFMGTDSWIPNSSLTPVFDSVVTAPMGEGWMEIILQTPFVYNNSDNLVIAILEDSPSAATTNEDFYCETTTATRSIAYYNNVTLPDVVNPPTGTLMSSIPETRLYFDALPTLPELSFNPATWDFGTHFCDTTSDPALCSAQNTGTGTLNIQSISLDDQVNFSLIDNNTYPMALNTAESMSFEVTFNPIDDGPLTGIVTITDDLRQTYTMTFTGDGFAATINIYPYSQTFDNATVPIEWTVDPIIASDSWEVANSDFGGHGPAGEASGNGGYFMGVDDSSPETVPAHLYSPPFDLSTVTNPLLTFNYWIGDAANESTLNIDVTVDGVTTSDVAVVQEPMGSTAWTYTEVSLAAFAGEVITIDFRAMESASFYGDICVDDIAIFDNATPPSAATLLAPTDGETGVPMTGQVSWMLAQGASGYFVSIGTDNPPTDVYDMADAGNNLFFDYAGLTSGTMYYWQVFPYNPNGTAPNSPVWSFTTFNDIPNAATLVSPAIGATYQNVFPTLVWASGGNFPDGYKLNLGTDNPPTDVYTNEDLGFVHTYVCPIELNIQTTYYWQIVPYNFVGDATNCPVWNFTTAPAGLVVVGNGIIEDQPLPIEPFYGYSYSQTIYLQTELNVQNQRIESILYHYDGAGTLSNEYEWVIYMGHTTETQFASTTSWLPITGFTEVFNATIPPPTGEGWIEFILDTPFVYNNTDNLVVAVEENQQAYGSSAEDFYCSAVSTPRSIYYYNDSTNPDPAAPPAAQGTPLFIPNTMFYFDELPIGPELFYRPLSQDYGTVFTNTQTPPVTFTIQNSGTGDLIINSLALGDATDFVLTDTNVYPLSLATAQTATFDVAFAPTNEGPLSTTIAITDDANVVSNIPLSGVGFNQTVSVYPYSENFDSGALPIGWEQGTDDAGDWAFGATTSSVDTGPQAGDHTSGTGMFAFTEASGFTNTRFDMISPPLDVTSLTNPFMTIWYNMYGSTMGTFHFDIWDGTQWVEDVFPEISGDQGQDWHFLDISLGGYGDIIQVRMRGVTGDNYYSDISFDDFSVWDNNQPPAATTLAAPTDGETGVAMTGAISWIPTAAASGYYVSMGTDNPPTDVYDVEDAGNTLSFDYAGLQPGVTYYWVITPYNPIGQGTSSPIWSFTSFNDIPNAATLVYPADGAMNSYVTMDLEWASGGNFPDGYRVYLGTSNPPNSVLDGLDVGFTNSYTIATPLQYSTQYYWQIIPYNFVGDATGCPLWTFTTHPAGMVILGDETLVDKHLPIEPYYGYSYSQSIHTLQEIGTPGFITSVSFYYNGGGTLSNSTQWVLYLGLTNQNEFTDGSSWVPIADLAEVWNGTVTAPAGAGWLDFPLPEDSWFLYDGSQNLVVAVEENQAAYGSSAEEFYCSARPNNRSIYYYSDGTNPDPSAPPVGTPLAFIPNTRLFTLPTGQNPYPIITPSSLNFGFVDVGAASDTRTITIRNVGQDSLLIDVTIALQGDDPGEFILADNNTYPIQVNYLETVDIDVTFMPSTEGWMNAEIVIIDNAPEGDRTTRPRQTHTLPISGRGYNLDNNDNPWQATQVSLNLEDYEEMIFPENETDWYSFWQTAPASVQMFTEAINGSQLDTYMCFYGPYDSPAQNFSDQMFIMADDDAHGNEQPEINMQITDSGFYYIRISHFSNVPAGMRPFKKRTEETRATTGEYSLTIISDNLVPPEDYLPPTNLAIESLYEAIEVTWGPPVIPDRSLAGYNVYRDDVIINTETVNSTIFLDYNVVIDETYEYKVSTVYEAPPGESVACDSVLHVHISVDAPIISDSFETYDDFATDFYPWTCMDVDGEATYGFNNGIDFPGENDAMAYIVFNPAGSTPPLQFAEAYNGDKFAACFSADSGSNDDWLITPHLQLGDNATGLNFWARSYTTQYGPEQLEVAISTTGNDPANFTPISGTEMISVPLEWTYYEFDLTNYAGDLIYVGFHCTSTQTFFLMLDEIKVISDGGTVDNHEQDIIPGNTELFSNYPNPFNPETTISFDLKQNERVSIDIYNIKGQKVKSLTNENYNAGRNHVVWTGTDSYNRKVSSGIYFFKMKAGTYTKTKKMILMK